MKKHFLFLACGAIMLASCGSNETKTDAAQTQQQIDSAANAKAAEQEAANKAKNDSLIKAQADSIVKAKEAEEAAKTKTTKTPKTTKPTKPTPPPAPAPAPAPAPSNPKAARFGDEKAKTEQQIESAKKKAERFK